MNPKKPFRPDTRQTSQLLKAGRAAAIDARRDSREHGLVITYIKGNYIYEEHPDGKVQRVGTIISEAQEQVHIIKGAVLRAR